MRKKCDVTTCDEESTTCEEEASANCEVKTSTTCAEEVKLTKVKFQLDFTAGIFIVLLSPARLSERLELVMPPFG